MKGLTQFARALAAKRIASVNRQRDQMLANPDEDAVHDFRVSLRRLQPVLDLFSIEPIGIDSGQASERSEKWLRAAGRVRDCDVVRTMLPEDASESLAKKRQERLDDLVKVVSEGPMPAPVQRRNASPVWAEPEVAMFAAITLPHLAKSYFRSGDRAAAKKRSLRRLHDFRLHGKTLRYSLELFEPLYGGKLKMLQRLLKQMQQVLGEMSDARAAIKLMKQINAGHSAIPELKEIASAKRDEFVQKWQAEVPSPEVGTAWVEYLRRFASNR